MCCVPWDPCQLLRLIALRLNPLGSSAMFYLAAAVSDFYVPWESMVSSVHSLLEVLSSGGKRGGCFGSLACTNEQGCWSQRRDSHESGLEADSWLAARCNDT